MKDRVRETAHREVDVLTGRVASGQGDLARWMTLYATGYEAAAGVRLFPGSLNVVLDFEWTLPHETITIGSDRVGRLVHLVPCVVGGHRCFVFRTHKAEQAGGDEHRILEILAEVRLRDVLGVVDGDEVDVIVDRPVP